MLTFYLNLIDTPEAQSKFEQLYHQYKRLMLTIANDILKDRSLAEDAVHEAFIKIIRYLEFFDDITCHKTKAFVVIVIRRISYDMLKKENNRKTLDILSVDEGELAVFDSLEHIEVETLAQKIAALPEVYREIIELKVYFDCSDKQLADILGISHAAARKRLERARNALAKRLKD